MFEGEIHNCIQGNRALHLVAVTSRRESENEGGRMSVTKPHMTNTLKHYVIGEHFSSSHSEWFFNQLLTLFNNQNEAL